MKCPFAVVRAASLHLIAFTFFAPATAIAQDAQARAGLDFFEAKIRPVLVQHCYECHSAKAAKLKGGLLLDSRAGLLRGGDSGPALVAGKPAESLLLKALRHEDDLKMPPKGKLPAAVLADFAVWIQRGAPDPREAPAVTGDIDFAAARKHWAFQPLAKSALPNIKQEKWPAVPVDHFILAKLEAAGLTPSPPADRRTLLRRAYYDLIGLPPTFAEVQAFANDSAPDAFAKVVARLLASPHYGERWGRHWLDVARYADTKDGVLMYGDDRIRPYAYTYRDYVIRAFNEDTPFDRFIHEQLAADLIEPKVEPWRLAAMGFLTLGRMFDNNVHDVIDDRIDTVTRGFLGLTVACARCHDHKYDPVPTADYYSLHGVFAGCEEPLDLPLTDRPEKLPGFAEFEKQVGPKRQQLQQFLDQQYALLAETARLRAGDYLVRVAATAPDPLETAIYFLSLAPEDLRPPLVARWRQFVSKRAKADDPVFGPWHDLIRLEDGDFASAARKAIDVWQDRPAGTNAGQINPLVRESLIQAKLQSKADVASAYGKLLRHVYEDAKKMPVPDQDPSRRQLLDIVAAPDSPAFFPKSQTRRYMSRGDTDSFGTKLRDMDRLAVRAADAPPRAMVLVDTRERVEPRILVRGNPSQPGAVVPRQFLRIVAGNERVPFGEGSGRLDLARAIAARDNPLTARVLVNRVWMHHFGEPLVSTPSDFGLRSSPPSHPELLDFLARRFIDDGWSLKKLHQLIMLSQTYQQASLDRPDCAARDQDNRLLWRQARRRLDLEAMRDTLLAVSGRLDGKMHGRPVDIAGDPLNRRRTVYGLVDRQSLPGLFRSFDFASPDQSSERRPFTTVPQQALFGMNAPFAIEQAKALAARSEVAASAQDRVKMLHHLVFAREPEMREVQAAQRFLAAVDAGPRSPLSAWQQYAQVLLLTNELMFVD